MPIATPNRQMCTQTMAHLTALTEIHTRQGETGQDPDDTR
jgi:hypothetical protein